MLNFQADFFLFFALIVPNTMYNMPRGFATLGLFLPPRVCSWDAWVRNQLSRRKAAVSLTRLEDDTHTPRLVIVEVVVQFPNYCSSSWQIA